jgi:hypothetical protein
MTWILYFYDAEDVEIGWVKTDSYEFEITHPDGPESYGEIRERLDRLENPTKTGGFTEVIEGWTMTSQQLVHLDLSGKEHLEYIETKIASIDGVASTALVDE